MFLWVKRVVQCAMQFLPLKGVVFVEQNVEITNEFIEKTVATGKQYCIYFYRSRPIRNHPKDQAENIQPEHLRYLFQLKAEGKLVINGPVTDDGELRGVGIFDTTDPEEVKRLLEGDPAVKAGRLIYEIHPWFGIPGSCLPK